ncbi:MAG TPA: TlpA disulfide reductase family protein [Dehalococcoidia bacterium]|nr:TlpA disulfide reductase family protein [Dehalococcoidia bacterium]
MTERPGPSAYNARSQLIRLAAAALVVGVSLLVLWQAGVIFQSDAASVDDGVSVQPATVLSETPGGSSRAVGLDEGNLAPDFEFSTFDGERMRLSDFRGRAVLLNFWATWCGPCRIELPDLEALLRQHTSDGLAVIAVNSGEKFGPANSYIKEIGVELTAWAYDPNGAVSRRYAVPGLQGLPFSYFIDANGVVRRVIVGQMSPKVMEAGVAEMLVAAQAR